MKKHPWLFFNLILCLGMGTAFADVENSAPSGVPVPIFTPDGGAVAVGTKVILANGTESTASPMPIYYNTKSTGSEEFDGVTTQAELEAALNRGLYSKALIAYPAGGIEITKETPVNAATAYIDAAGKVTWSAVITANFTIEPEKPDVPTKPETPEFTPDGGEIQRGTAIKLSSTCSSCDIYYTFSASDAVFDIQTTEALGQAEEDALLFLYESEGIFIEEDQTIKAAVVWYNDDETLVWSEVVTRAFTATGEAPETVAAPVIFPQNDVVVRIGNWVTMTCSTLGSKIYYTTDGTAPYTANEDGVPVAVKEGTLEYTTAFRLTEDMLIKQGEVYALIIRAVATKGDQMSRGNGAGYVVYPAAPEFSVEAGEVERGTKVSITCVPAVADIYYTTDGTTPTMENSPKYTAPIEITEDMTVRALSVLGQYQSLAQVAYTIAAVTQVETVAKPEFSVKAGEVEKSTKVEITCATEGAVIYYTVDGTEPTAESAKYEAPLVVNEAMTIKAIAIKGEAKSEVATAAYTIDVTANEELELAGVSVYPNPSNGEFNLELPVAATVEVFAINGVLMQHFNANAGEVTLSIHRSGIYFLRITGEGRTAIKRVIVR